MGKSRLAALPKDLKKQNDFEILRIICAEKKFTVARISAISHISRQTVTKAVEAFISRGLVIEGSLGCSTKVGGRKPIVYQLNPDKYIIIVSVRERKMQFFLNNMQGKHIDALDISKSWKSYDEYLEMIKDAVHLLMTRWEIRYENLAGIMVCSGRILDEESGIVDGSWWSEASKELRMDICNLFPEAISVNIGNVSTVLARSLADNTEMFGKRVVVVYIDTGVGIAFVEDGKLMETRHNLVGELGHMTLDYNSDKVCRVGDVGCFEELLSERNFMELLDKLPVDRREAVLNAYDMKGDLREHIVHMAEKGNLDAKELTEYMADIFAAAFKNLEFAFDPDLFLIQGSFVSWVDALRESIISRMKQNQYLKNIDVKIEKAQDSAEKMLVDGSIGMILHSLLGGE